MSIETLDPQIASLITQEEYRQHHTLDMIASENYAPLAVRQATGSVLTNKYAEGYPHRRYYGGCEVVDQVEELAIERVKTLFGCEYANVQPHSGSTANAAVYSAFLVPGDTLMGLDLAHGGHLTHGMPLNFSGKLYNIVTYGVDERTQRIDMNKVREIARANKPKMIVAGWSAYSRILDFEAFRSIADEVGAYLLVDMAHFAGLVAAGLHPNPFPYADVVTSTTHKTLCGPRGGLILSHSKYARKLDSSVFPGHQGGPSMNTIAGKAVAFHLASQPDFIERQKRTVEGAQIIAQRFLTESTGRIDLLTGGTDVHLVLLDLRGHFLNGLQAEQRLQEIGIITNRNAIPFDPRPPKITSGLRIGTPALATRGFGTEEFTEVADIIVRALNEKSHEHNLTQRVKNLTTAFTLN